MIPTKAEILWSDFSFRMLTNTITHPIEYAKVLIQIGYEPIPPRRTTTIFRQPALALPNVFQYVRYIKNVDGYTGCYRGLIPKLCASTVSAAVFEKTYKSIKFVDEPEIYKNKSKYTFFYFLRCMYEFIRELISRMIGIIVSHPLDVIALRMMAQFVGGETKYKSFVEVYKENGIMGYYAGLVPRLIGNAAVLILVSSCTYAIDKYVINYHGEIRPNAITIIKWFHIVWHLPPQMPIYDNWLDCWSHLSDTNQLKRGNRLLWRYYTGPQVMINGVPMPLNQKFGYSNLYLKDK
ncbi:Mitochondrial carrier like protein 2 [Habropoda laboriosa]|uniref:Mitochondrial carrier like protein 2 n=1 Tax=Habropoda laboriosa TaxID=597456 RepID=A0A0L7QX78_9HYME|nr:Mitochondrial carrier like protein 2 [Habropoda laboriosa]